MEFSGKVVPLCSSRSVYILVAAPFIDLELAGDWKIIRLLSKDPCKIEAVPIIDFELSLDMEMIRFNCDCM